MTIELHQEGKVAIFTINNPSKMNALATCDLNELQEYLIEFNNNKDLWAGIITGTGEKAFCSGFDVGEFDTRSQADRKSIIQANPICGLEINKPLIAAVNGAAVGGGLELMLICDLRIASEMAVFGFPEVKLGLIPSWGATQRLPRQISWCQAAEMLFTGENIDAQTALRFGLINRIAPQKLVLEYSVKLANLLCQSAPLAIRAAKEAMLKSLQVFPEEGLQIENALNTYLKTTGDFREGIEAFHHKRQPHFKGF